MWNVENERAVMAAAVSEVLEASGRNRSELARHLGISHASVSRKLSGKQAITEEELARVAEFVNLPWPEFARKIGLSLTEKTPHAGGYIDVVPIRVIDQEASASLRGGRVVDTLWLAESGLKLAPTNYRAVEVSGNCMAPELLDGDYAVVELGSAFESGDIVVAAIPEGDRSLLHVKRIRQAGVNWYLEDNEGNRLELQDLGVVEGLVIRVDRDLRRSRRRRS